MKNSYFIIISLCICAIANAQTINFPDANFKARLLESNSANNIARNSLNNYFKIDENNDGEIQKSEALKVFSLDVSNYRTITTLSGIENFTNLKFLDCSSNVIEDLDARPLTNLQTLICSSNRFISLNIAGLSNLNRLVAESILLTNIDLSGLQNLKEIEFNNGTLTSLDLKGLISLESISCRYNQLKSISNISDCINLKKMYTENNLIENLNVQGCVNLESLICRYNKITSLNISGLPKLRYLEAGGESLTAIELNGISNIEQLHVDYSNLTTLDLSQYIKLKYVSSRFNAKLTTIFAKNGMSESIDFYRCPVLKYICADESQFENIKNTIDLYQDKNVNYNSYCSFTPSGIFYTIKGKTTLDSNNNGQDNSNVNYPNLNFSITDGTTKGSIISNSSREYAIYVGEGTQTITPILENINYFKVSPATVNISFPALTSPFTQDFLITPNGNHNDLEVKLLPLLPARPGFDATYTIVYKNKGTTTLSGTVVLNFNDAVLDYVSAVPVINRQVMDQLTWDYSNLKPFEIREITITLNVNSPMETPAVNIGDRLSFNALINPVTTDEKIVDNSSALRQSVVGSFDPNDKTCLEGDIVTPDLIGEYVNYVIRFENTGTYPAENIVVKDIIDLSKFDISTLIPIKASHSYSSKISEGNKVEFIFEKINLPFDNANNDGYIAFKIKTLPTLMLGDSFANEASIYFDYNFPIVTNKATSTFKSLAVEDFDFSSFFKIYPNPVDTELHITAKNEIEVQSIAIYDILGQIILALPDAQKSSTIDVAKLTTGTYFLKIKTDKGFSNSKFLKK